MDQMLNLLVRSSVCVCMRTSVFLDVFVCECGRMCIEQTTIGWCANSNMLQPVAQKNSRHAGYYCIESETVCFYGIFTYPTVSSVRYMNIEHIYFLQQNYAFKVTEIQRTMKSITFIHSYICPFNQLPKRGYWKRTLRQNITLCSSRFQLNFIWFRKYSRCKDQFIIIHCDLTFHLVTQLCVCVCARAQCVMIIIHLLNLNEF